MTDIGRAFAFIAEDVNRKHGFGSNKMASAYTLHEVDDFKVSEYDRERAAQLDQLVESGYLRKFITEPYLNGRRCNHVRSWVRGVCFGLTAKGWEVAPKYIAALEKENKITTAELKARNLCERFKSTDHPITYEDAFAMAMRGEL